MTNIDNTTNKTNKKLLLCILDGFGIRAETHGNAAIEAKFVYSLFQSYASTYTQIQASEQYVGLPVGQFGNSEVGHMTIGAGRVINQKIDIINEAIASKAIEKSDVLANCLSSSSGAVHVMGIFSAGGVHGHMDHIFWAVDYLRGLGRKFWLHLFLDGRDVAYNSAHQDLAKALESGRIKTEEIATVQGRFYAMDRDNNMDRIDLAYNAIARGEGEATDDFLAAMARSYEAGVYDEQVRPMVGAGYKGASEGDIFWMLNYRTDRIKQILSTIQGHGFRTINMVNVTEAIDSKAHILFPDEPLKDTLGEMVSRWGLRQLRVAETEKYAHVTYFFNGGREAPFEGEDRILVPSPKTPDYSTCPAMSCRAVKDAIIEAMKAGDHNLIVANFANPDMVGHTGVYEATCQAIHAIDSCVEEIYNNLWDYDMILTADHGNCEEMYASDGKIHKSHTCNPVPFVFIGRSGYVPDMADVKTLADVAGVVMDVLGCSG